jgi:probable F420-dependent oxidoreductase
MITELVFSTISEFRRAAEWRRSFERKVAVRMQIGVVYPQTELPTDRSAALAYAQRVEELGYRHLIAYDHVLGVDLTVHRDSRAALTLDTTLHEPLVFYGFLAGVTNLELVTGVLVAPQRQTVLLAKQAAEVDILTQGNFRLGIGVGWNPVEYDALGQDFTTRGRRQEEQIALLRQLWTERAVHHQGRFDRVVGAGLAPLPVQRPIPIWLGGQSQPAYQRIGRLADGWFPQVAPGPQLDEALSTIQEAATTAQRDPKDIAMEGRADWRSGNLEGVIELIGQWRNVGASHVTINTMGAGLTGVDGHLKALTEAAEALDLGAA